MLISADISRDVISATPDFAAVRTRDYRRLDAQGHAYLDYTGSALYPDSVVAKHTEMLRDGIFGNPHAENPASMRSTAVIQEARRRVLEFLDADPLEYVVCFTANATGALALVGSSFPFSPSRPFALATDNHNSVNGIRGYAQRVNAPVHYLPLTPELRLDEPHLHLADIARHVTGGLFAFPAQSNFSGVKHPLSLVAAAQSHGFRVLLDAAALLPMTRLSLRRVPADFVALSFYKMFGYPSGVGALVARRDALAELERPWFSGGTVDFVSVQNGVHALRAGEEAFEDGTANFLGISAITSGLDYLESLGLENVERHSTTLTASLIGQLAALRHSHDRPLVEVYGPRAGERGATVAFNVLDRNGSVVPFGVVEARAHSARVSVRGGCFCNPGASEVAFGFPAGEAARCLASASGRGWSVARFTECMNGRAVGAVRASFGAPSNGDDLQRLVSVVESFAR